MKICDEIANGMLILNSIKIICIPLKYYVCKPDISKSVITAMRFTIDDKHLLNGCE